jgi:L-amino acid N-acyltransferase YncA
MRIIACGQDRAAEILAILNDAIENSTALYDYRPRALATMQAWFEAKERGQYPVIGIVSDQERLLGFGTYGAFRNWPAYKYTIEHSLYVERTQRGQGLGRRLLVELIEAARRQNYHAMIGGIDAQNAASIALHRQMRFQLCGTIRHAGFKFGRWLDLQFHQLLLDTPAHPADG